MDARDSREFAEVYFRVFKKSQGARQGFFSRLEEEPELSGYAVKVMPQNRYRPKKRRGVYVMAAGVHDSGYKGLVGQIVFFLYGQGVHVAAQGKDGLLFRRGGFARKLDPQARFAYPLDSAFFRKGFPQDFFYVVHGVVLLHAQFRVPVKMPPHLLHPGFNVCC
jgi:hypothetical protein